MQPLRQTSSRHSTSWVATLPMVKPPPMQVQQQRQNGLGATGAYRRAGKGHAVTRGQVKSSTRASGRAAVQHWAPASPATRLRWGRAVQQTRAAQTICLQHLRMAGVVGARGRGHVSSRRGRARGGVGLRGRMVAAVVVVVRGHGKR